MMSFQTMFNKAIAQEEARLEWLMTMPEIGICFKGEKMEVREYEDDPDLREVLVAWQQERIRQMRLTEHSLAHQPANVSYPLQED